MPSKKNHTHKFILVEGKFVKTWRCGVVDCAYMLHRSMEHVLQGRRSICWTCNKPFVMTEDNLNQDMPTCIECTLKESGDFNALEHLNKLAQTPNLKKEPGRAIVDFPIPRAPIEPPSDKSKSEEPKDEVEVYNPTEE